MLAGYWHKGGIEIYRLKEAGNEKLASGDPERMKPVRALGKKVLVVGRDLLLHTRKRFPPASEADIRKAVQMEAGELFPLKNPAHCINIFERTETYTSVDVWAWDASGEEKLRRVFPYTHILPEDMAFTSDEPEIAAVCGKESSYLLAYGKNGFLGGSTFRGDLSGRHIEVLLKGISRHAGEIRRVRLCGTAALPRGLENRPLEVVQGGTKGYPVSLDFLPRLNLKPFRLRAEREALPYLGLAARALLSLLLAYGLFLFLSERNYDAAAREVREKIGRLAAGMIVHGAGQGNEEDVETIAELKEKRKAGTSPLRVMDMLAGHLPGQSVVMRMLLNENLLELTLTTKDPVAVIKALGGAEGVKAVKLKGAPAKDSKGVYTCALTVELR
ncbi:MAG: hypothetical protein K8I29_12455 [Alphaproteobacteria bacterium]|uniref:GspL periplasmic domain-containing protein n=1 Tax=Candidatus Nitrobium versatile TaxID=2884831 RepID=A0A953M230_9BACT|nr:hypothetical protein [Candidatus Nitrobium versatile]